MSTLASLMVQIGADTARLSSDMQKATTLISGFTRKAESAFKGLAATAIAAFSFQQVISSMKQAVDAMDKLNEASQKVGMSVEDLQLWHLAAKQAGVEAEAFDKGMTKLAKSMYTESQVFEYLGLSVNKSNGELKTLGEFAPELAKKMQEMGDGTAKTGAAQQALGKAGAELIPVFNKMAESAEEIKKQMGYIATYEDTQRADKFNDTLDLMKRRSEGIKMAIMSGALPALQDLANAFSNTKNTGEAFYSVGESIGWVLKGIATGALGVAAAFDIMGTYIGQNVAKAARMSEAFGSGGIEGYRRLYKEWRAEGPDLVTLKMERYGTMIENLWKGSETNILKRPSFKGGISNPSGGGSLGDETEAMRAWLEKAKEMDPWITEFQKKKMALNSEAEKLTNKWGEQKWILEGLGIAMKNLEQQEFKKALEEEYKTVDNLNDEFDRELMILDALDKANIDKQKELAEIYKNAGVALSKFDDEFETFTKNAADELEAFKKGAIHDALDLEKGMKKAFGSMEDSFAEFCKTGEFNFTSFANSVIDDISRIAFKLAVFGNVTGEKENGSYGGLAGVIMSGISSLFGNPLTGQSTGFGDWTEGLAFASGGVVSRPTVFPMANGNIGLAGEAGAEGILPLKRTSSGDLGVSAEGGGGGTNIFISAVDSKSFLDMCRRNPGAIIEPVTKAMQNNEGLRGTMRRTR